MVDWFHYIQMERKIMEKNKISLIVVRISAILLCLLTMIMIFLFSAQNAGKSSDESRAITDAVVRLLYPDFAERPASEQKEIRGKVETFVRKTAHFLEFALLGISASLILRTFSKKPLFTYVIPIAFGTLYAVTDEIHQLFVSGRAGRFTDVLIDALGTAVGVFILGLIIMIIRKISKKHRSDIDKAEI